MSQVWSQNMRETIRKKLMKPRGKTFAHCGLIGEKCRGGGGPLPGYIGLRCIISLLIDPFSLNIGAMDY